MKKTKTTKTIIQQEDLQKLFNFRELRKECEKLEKEVKDILKSSSDSWLVERGDLCCLLEISEPYIRVEVEDLRNVLIEMGVDTEILEEDIRKKKKDEGKEIQRSSLKIYPVQ